MDRPGGVYTVRVASVTKGHRIKSQPVRLSMSKLLSAGPSPHATSEAHLSSTPPSPAIATTTPAVLVVSPSLPILPPFIPPPPPPPSSSGQYRNNNRLSTNFTSIGADYRFPPTANSAGVVYVRGEEVGIVILVLIGKPKHSTFIMQMISLFPVRGIIISFILFFFFAGGHTQVCLQLATDN